MTAVRFAKQNTKKILIAAGLGSQEGDVFSVFDAVKNKDLKNKNHESPNFILQNKIDPMLLQSKSKQPISDSENLFFDKITKKSYKSLAFVGQNKQLLPDSEVSLREIYLSKNENSSLKNRKIDSSFFLLNPFSKVFQNKNEDAESILFALDLQSQSTANQDFLRKSTEKEVSQNRTNLATTLDNLSYRTIGIGFPLLTIGILSGAVWANEAWGSYWSWDPKETWAHHYVVFICYLPSYKNY